MGFPEHWLWYICPRIQCFILSMIDAEKKDIFAYAHFLLVASHSLSSMVGSGEVVGWLRALGAVGKDLDLILNNHMETQNCP